MDITTVAVSAVVGAAVAIGTKLITDQVEKAKAEIHQAQVHGYYQGRESIIQESFRNVEPRDFTQVH